MGKDGYGPRCPNHRVILQKTNTRGVGICPVSGYHFEYEEDDAEREKKVKMTFNGPVYEEDWKVQSLDGPGG